MLFIGGLGCKKPNYQSQEQASSTVQNAGDYINNNFDFTLFAAAVKKAGLFDTLNNPGASYTVLVPTNEAFNADSILSPTDFDKFPIDTLRYMVRSYILPTKIFFSGIPSNLDNLYPNLNGVNLYFSPYQGQYQGAFTIEGVQVAGFENAAGNATTYDVTEANAVIHVMDSVINVNACTVQDFVAARPDLSDFAAALKRFGLWDSLRTANPLTLYAVSNSGMESRGLTADSVNNLDPTLYNPILFSGYVQYPHHLFTEDLMMIGLYANSGANAVFPSAGGYSFNMTGVYYGYGCYLLDPSGNYVGPIFSPYGYPETTPYVPNGTNYACSNGVVHILSDLVVLPNKVHN